MTSPEQVSLMPRECDAKEKAQPAVNEGDWQWFVFEGKDVDPGQFAEVASFESAELHNCYAARMGYCCWGLAGGLVHYKNGIANELAGRLVNDPAVTLCLCVAKALDPDEPGETTLSAHTTKKEACAMPDNSSTRLEQLLVEQNALMLRQLALSEERQKQHEGLKCVLKKPHHILQGVDLGVQKIFKAWRAGFHTHVRLYVSEMKKVKAANESGELLEPFRKEASTPWQWAQTYRAVAKPIDTVDTRLANGTFVGSGSANSDGTEYDIDVAFGHLRYKHARELHEFVVAHQAAYLEKIIEELSLPQQIHLLEDQVGNWIAEHGHLLHPQAPDRLKGHVQSFVEIVYHEEMANAESSIGTDRAATPLVLAAVRVCCVIVLLFSVMVVDHERLVRVFGIVFTLLCGMGLLWEDGVLHSLRTLFGVGKRYW